VKFDRVNFSNVNTNGFALWEVAVLLKGWPTAGPVTPSHGQYGGFNMGIPKSWWVFNRLKNTKSWSNDWFGGLGLLRKPPFGHFYGKKRVFIFEHWEISPLLPGSNGEMMFFNCNPAILGYILMIRPYYA
jgi:hypothetical protein